MGQIVAYDGGPYKSDYKHAESGEPTWAPQDKRQLGMRELGIKLVDEYKQRGTGFREAVRDTIKYFSDSSNGFELRYEFKNEQDEKKSYRIIADQSLPSGLYRLVKAKNNVKKGWLQLEIEKDRVEKKIKLHRMHITAPNRFDKQDVFDYTEFLTEDLEQIRDQNYTANKTAMTNYLQGALTFQRCL